MWVQRSEIGGDKVMRLSNLERKKVTYYSGAGRVSGVRVLFVAGMRLRGCLG